MCWQIKPPAGNGFGGRYAIVAATVAPLLTCGIYCLELGLCLCDLSLKTDGDKKAKYIPYRTQHSDLHQTGSSKIMNELNLKTAIIVIIV